MCAQTSFRSPSAVGRRQPRSAHFTLIICIRDTGRTINDVELSGIIKDDIFSFPNEYILAA